MTPGTELKHNEQTVKRGRHTRHLLQLLWLMTYYEYSVTVNSKMTNDPNKTTMRAELHVEQARTYAPTEQAFTEQYEGELVNILLSRLEEAFADGIPSSLEITGLGFESKETITSTTKTGGRKGFTRKQLQTQGKVTIKRVNVNGKYYVRFSDRRGTFKRVKWRQSGKTISQWRTLFNEARNATQNTDATLPDTVTDNYIYVIEPGQSSRELWTDKGTWRHQTWHINPT